MPEITKKQRLSIVLSVVWLVISLSFIFNMDDSRYIVIEEVSGFFPLFMLIGILPVVTLWGLWWVNRTK